MEGSRLVWAWGDVLLPQGISMADLSVIHPLSINSLPSAATHAGAAVARRDQQKRVAVRECSLMATPAWIFFCRELLVLRAAGDDTLANAWR
jgi:hypothetical protein